MTLFPTRSNKGRTAALLGGVGIGAALMYLLDPDRGARRRALARDKAVRFGRVAGERLGARSRDLRNRAQGLAAKMKHQKSEEPLPGEPHESAEDVPAFQGAKGPRSKADRGATRYESDSAGEA